MENIPFGELRTVYKFARDAHCGQYRKSGEKFITHPVYVARTVRDNGGDRAPFFAALLHDVVEDTGYGLEDIRVKFGDEVCYLVDGLTEEEDLDKTFLKLSEYFDGDKRLALVKLADVKHNLLNPIRRKLSDKSRRTAEKSIELGRKSEYNRLCLEVETLLKGAEK
jgi:GTP diphosphokinase / guanosine-3',5'-bis(diphosphate) 3'-diphosphatase